MSKTPRTDAKTRSVLVPHCIEANSIKIIEEGQTVPMHFQKVVEARFARQLETELNELKSKCEKEGKKLAVRLQKKNSELNEARGYIERLKVNSEKQINFQTLLVDEAEKDIDRKNALIKQMKYDLEACIRAFTNKGALICLEKLIDTLDAARKEIGDA